MFFGHYLAWICAGLMGAGAALMLQTKYLVAGTAFYLRRDGDNRYERVGAAPRAALTCSPPGGILTARSGNAPYLRSWA